MVADETASPPAAEPSATASAEAEPAIAEEVSAPQKTLDVTGYVGLRASFARAKVNGLIPSDDFPQLSSLLEVNNQTKVTYRPRAHFYLDVSLIAQVGGNFRGAAADGSEVVLPDHDVLKPLVSINEFFWLHEVVPSFNVLVGKKRIVWGPGQAINPTDLLNVRKDPTDPAAQRTGAYLARLEFPFETMTFTALFAPAVTQQASGIPYQFITYPSWNQRDTQAHYLVALRAYALILDSDVNLMAFYGNRYNDAFERKFRFGATFSRSFFQDYEFHGELLMQSGSSREYVNGSCVASPAAAVACGLKGVPFTSTSRINDAIYSPKLLLGGKRQFSDDSVLSVEYLYQEDGFAREDFQNQVSGLSLYKQARAAGIPIGATGTSAATPNDGIPQRLAFEPLAKHYAFVTFQKPRIKDDFTIQATVIANLQDLSTLWAPSVIWSVRDWLNLSLFGFFPVPGPNALAAQDPANAAYESEYTLLPMRYRFMFEMRVFY